MSTEKRLLLAVVLMMAVVFLVNIIFPPEPPPEGPVDADGVAPTGQEPRRTTPEPRAPALPDAIAEDEVGRLPGLTPTPEVALGEDTAWVTTPLYRLGFAQRGARLVSAQMLQFESLAPSSHGEPVQLVPHQAEGFFTHAWVVEDDTLDLSGVLFDIQPAGGLELQSRDRTRSLLLSYQHPSSAFRLDVEYTFHPDSYVIGMRGRVSGVPAAGWWTIGLGAGLLSNEWDPEQDYRADLAFTARGGEGTQSLKVASLEPGERASLNGPFDWVGVRTKYFAAAIVLTPDAAPEERLAGLLITGLREEYRADGVASFPLGREGEFTYRIYMGPQDFGRLSAVGYELDQVKPYGYKWLQPMLRPLAAWITGLLVWSHNTLNLGYGWILILFGIGIRVLLFPLYQKSMRSQMATMRVQPLMKEIQTKYKDEPQKLQQEMIKLYRVHKINPLGGCLPMLLPFPILIALFFVFRDTIELRGVPFLWLPDLSQPDPLFIIPILMGASVFLLQWIGQRSTPAPNPQMKMMMYIMPVMLIVLFWKFAAGLNLYYATMNLASLPQQLYLARERKAAVGEPAPAKAKS